MMERMSKSYTMPPKKQYCQNKCNKNIQHQTFFVPLSKSSLGAMPAVETWDFNLKVSGLKSRRGGWKFRNWRKSKDYLLLCSSKQVGLASHRINF